VYTGDGACQNPEQNVHISEVQDIGNKHKLTSNSQGNDLRVPLKRKMSYSL
jgi:hypothetical protein